MMVLLAIMGADFDAETDDLLREAVKRGDIRFCCPAHAEMSNIVVNAIERRN